MNRALDALSQVVFKLVAILMKAAPIGAFGAFAFTIGRYGIESVINLAALVATDAAPVSYPAHLGGPGEPGLPVAKILGVFGAAYLALTLRSQDDLIGTPILTGSLVRVLLGVWADQIGGRRVFAGVMVLAAIATFLTSFADTYAELLFAALGVGIAGGSFSVGVTYVSKFYPKERQGTALGIFGAGNVGSAVTKFVAPFVPYEYRIVTYDRVSRTSTSLS